MVLKRFIGSFIDTPELGVVRVLHDYSLVIDESGFISSFSPKEQDSYLYGEVDTVTIPPGGFMLPSFCDLHLHAPQFLYQGTGLHLPLMEWLDQYAFKAEERIDSDPILAEKTYSSLAKRLKEHGTGAVLLFGTIKEETNIILAKVMQEAGIRAFIGKLSMDVSSRPTYKEPSAQEAIASAISFNQKMQSTFSYLSSSNRLVEPVLTPRFTPSCSDELLAGLGELSERENLRIQSHLAEARDQVDWVHQERGIPDIDVFDKHHLLTPRTIQAHCTFLTKPCFDRLHNIGTGIAHCPLSNSYFSSLPFPLREALSSGVRVGLGTDIAGGYSIDIMNTMRTAVVVSRIREGARKESGQTQGESLSINWKEALYLATKGGATTLQLPRGTGTFEIGAPFDAQLIRLHENGLGIGPVDVFDELGEKPISEELLEKWWCIGDTRNRVGLWIQGKQCHP